MRHWRDLIATSAIWHCAISLDTLRNHHLHWTRIFVTRFAIIPSPAENMLAKAWWATDYHISWLAGALAIYARGDYAEERTWPNQPVPALCSHRSARDKGPVERQIAEGNQEDIDLLIAVENHLILIEVKAYGSWDIVQLESKTPRVRLLKAFNEELEQEQCGQ